MDAIINSGQIDDFIERMKQDFPQIEMTCATGTNLDFPSYDLLPYDYLEFADAELGKETTASKINCVSNLKRAVDCQLDTFIHVLHLEKAFKRASVGAKIEFISWMGLFHQRSIVELNRIRNKMEHEYAIPDIRELEVYFELVYAFVSVIDTHMLILASECEIQWIKEVDQTSIFLDVEYEFSERAISFTFADQGKNTTYRFDQRNLKELAYGLKVYFYMCKSQSIMSKDLALKHITIKPI